MTREIASILGHQIPVDLESDVSVSVDLEANRLRLEFRHADDPGGASHSVVVAEFHQIIELLFWNVDRKPWGPLISIDEGPAKDFQTEPNALRRSNGPFAGRAVVGKSTPRQVSLETPGMDLSFIYAGHVEWTTESESNL